MKKTVVAIFNSMDQAHDAADQLINNGFNRDDIDVSSGKEYAEDTHDGDNAITRFFKNLFGSDDNETERYSKVAERGYVVTAYTESDEEARRVASLLDEYGAIDVDDNYHRNFSGKEYSGNTSYNDRTENYDDVNDITDKDVNRTIPIIEEDIEVGKREVVTGGVRIRSRIVEKPVEETLRLREEHINVERNKVDRAATDDEINRFETGTVELTERSEIPDVRKTSKVVEEISLEKEVEHRDETVKDTVRKTEVDIDDIDPDDRNSKTRRKL